LGQSRLNTDNNMRKNRKIRAYLDNELSAGVTLELDKRTRHYFLSVLRLQKDDQVIVFNGREQLEATATIESLNKKHAVLAITSVEKVSTESTLDTCLWQAVSRSDRMDFAIQKATELGVSSIQPVTSERSPWRLKSAQLEKKMQHWQGIVISACEQSGRTRLPQLHPPKLLPELLEQRQQSRNSILLDPTADTGVNNFRNSNQGIDILCGPEGGFNLAEIELASKHGFKRYHIGPRILRTETAAVCVLGILQSKFGDCS